MTNQKLFEALERVCGFIALESDLAEIIVAVEADKMPSTETIEQAAEKESEYLSDWEDKNMYKRGFKDGAGYQSSQPNPHRITDWQVSKLCRMYENGTVKLSRMVEILNEIAAGKHKERIEI